MAAVPYGFLMLAFFFTIDLNLFHSRGVTVNFLEGDARRGDSVKPNGQFGDADLQTVAALRSALATLPGYLFQFLDNHATLAGELQHATPDLVLNLCDEGYGTDPSMEAHVP